MLTVFDGASANLEDRAQDRLNRSEGAVSALRTRCAAAALCAWMLLLGSSCESGELSERAPETTFVALGHFRGLVPSSVEVLEQLADAINGVRPDYVFLLGDLTAYASDDEHAVLARHFLGRLAAPVYVAAGNHDRLWGLDRFRERHGPRYALIQDPRANLVVIDSNDPFAAIAGFLEGAFAQIERETRTRPTILFAHHELWIERAPPEERRPAAPKFETHEMMELLRGRVDHIVAGDAAREFEVGGSGDIRVYSTGLWFAGQDAPVRFAVGRIGDDGTLVVTSTDLDIPADDLWNTTRQEWLGRKRPRRPKDS